MWNCVSFYIILSFTKCQLTESFALHIHSKNHQFQFRYKNNSIILHHNHRFYWLIALVVAMGLWAMLAAPQWTRWREAPVVITMETAPRVITSLPFPSATVCTITPNLNVTFDYMEYRERFLGDRQPPLSPEDSQILQDISQLCFNYELIVGIRELNISRNIDVVAEEFSIHNFTYRYIHGFGSSKNVGQTPNMKGMCYVFNSMPGELIFRENTFHRQRNYVNVDGGGDVTWDPDTGYKEDKIHHYPERALGAGEHFGFELRVNFSNIAKACYERRISIDVSLHPPTEIRNPSSVHLVLEPKSKLVAALMPHVVSTSQSLRYWYTTKQRQCYFADEKYLRFFTYYSQSNCEYECLSNLTLQHCDCVPFYYPHSLEAPICIETINSCYFNMLDMMSNDTATKPCGCLPSCNEIEYQMEVTKSQSHEENMASVLLFYPRRFFLSYARTEVFGIVDLIATVGGLLGLFVGMSLLSAAELIFWILKLLLGRSSYPRTEISTNR